MKDTSDEQSGESKPLSRKSSRQSSLADFTHFQELQDKNKSLEFVNTRNEQKLILLDKENTQLRNQLLQKEAQKIQSLLNKQIVQPISTQSDGNSINHNNSLQNILEQEEEETPLNRPSFYPLKRHTISFNSSSNRQTNFSGFSNINRRKSVQKIKMILNNEGRDGLDSSVRQLFSSTQSNTPRISIQNSGGRSSLKPSINDKKYENITPKIDSNLEKRPYQEELAKKNKLKTNNIQNFLNSSLTQNNSNDITMISYTSQHNSKDKQCSIYNEDLVSRVSQSCHYEDLNHIFNAPNQNLNVKQKYYSYLLEESFIQQEKFVSKISKVINNVKQYQ